MTKAVKPDKLKIEVHVKRPTRSRGLLVRLNFKEDVEILKQAVKWKGELKDKEQCAVPKLRKFCIIIHDVTKNGAKVNGSAVEQTSLEEGSIQSFLLREKI